MTFRGDFGAILAFISGLITGINLTILILLKTIGG